MLDPMAKVAVVTGGSRGIGAAVVSAFAAGGWDVALGYHSEEETAERVLEQLEDSGTSAIACRVDVADEEQVVAFFNRARSELGTPAALVNNAGIVAPARRLEHMTAERMNRMFEVNVLGTFLCAREAVRCMSSRRGGPGGAIVNVSSGATKVGSPGEYVDYAASKGAVEVLTLGLAKEVGAEGIRVNAVRPGIVDTEIHRRNEQPDKPARLAPSVPLGRPGQPDEVAAAIYWLCSDAASYVTGAILDVTGGR
jgi:NAD(P)-dependent dehydrogenase (short-subunit alcohol dehydrogenase family)